MNHKKLEKIIVEFLSFDPKNIKDIDKIKRILSKKYSVKLLENAQILKFKKKLKINEKLVELLKKRAIRTLSGVAPVAIITKPYECPGECAYCPSEKDMPRSYLSNEPAVMRAIRCNFDPFKQVQDRIQALINNGHMPSKIELIVIGGTWSYFPDKYKYWYICNCFLAVNNFFQKEKKRLLKNISLKTLKEILKKEQKKNTLSKLKIIGITLETRPDYIDEKELWQMRDLGATRVEIGVQAIDDQVLKKNKRGHDVDSIKIATSLLRKFGFKITYHIMPGLPGSDLKKDFQIFKKLFSNKVQKIKIQKKDNRFKKIREFINLKYKTLDNSFEPDQIKFYPTVVTKGSLLYKWYKKKKYFPYAQKDLIELIRKCKSYIPAYVRIIRLIRDIPSESIIAGNMVTNLRQILQDKGIKCSCIRCREIKSGILKKDYQLIIRKYEANDGLEYFLSFESFDEKYIYAFCRLRINKINYLFQNTAFIRELHVYGSLTNFSNKGKVQHLGLGKELIKISEFISSLHKQYKLAIISGVGAREYYKKLGYRLYKTYMVKKISN